MPDHLTDYEQAVRRADALSEQFTALLRAGETITPDELAELDRLEQEVLAKRLNLDRLHPAEGR